MSGGRHRVDADGTEWTVRPARARGRRIATTAAVGLLVTAVVAAVLVGRSHRPDDRVAGACAGDDPLSVVAAPDIAPVLHQAARAVSTSPTGCTLISVTSQDPVETASRLPGASGSAHISGSQQAPDVWVPDSSAWLRVAASGQTGQTGQTGLFPTSGVSLARSPLVVAMSQALAQSLGWPSTPLGWADLTTAAERHKLARFSVPSPQTSTVGLLTVLAVNAAMHRNQPDPGIAQMRTLILRSRITDADADLSALLRRMARAPDDLAAAHQTGAFPLTEQRLWAYNRDGHRAALVGIYPRDATVEADYPLVVSRVAAADPGHAALAARLAGWFGTGAATRALRTHGFRRAGRGGPVPDGLGLADNYPAPTPLPTDPATVRAAVTGWADYKSLAFQVLVLVDGSGSMNAPVRDKAGRIRTKASLLGEAGKRAGQLFGAETSVGLWEFSTHQPGAPYQVVVPYGPIDGVLDGPDGPVSRRAAMVSAATRFQAFDGSGTPLDATVLRAVTAMRDRYRPGALTMVVVLTDGRDESSPFHLDTREFLVRLSKVEDPKRPVPVFSVGYGADADMTALTAMARATGGQAIGSTDPADLATAIARIFLAAHEQK